MRGSFIGHGDYISAAIAEMARLSVSSSNSLRNNNRLLRKRAQSLGRLGEMPEGDTYQYQEINKNNERNGQTVQDWHERQWQVYSDGGSPRPGTKTSATLPNGLTPKAKSIFEVNTASVDTPMVMPRDILNLAGSDQESKHGSTERLRTYERGTNQRANQRPVSCLYNTTTYGFKTNQRLSPSPELAEVSVDMPSRPNTTYNIKVTCQP